MPPKTVNRDAATGRFVSDKKVEDSPKTTYQQTVEPKTEKKKKDKKKDKKKKWHGMDPPV